MVDLIVALIVLTCKATNVEQSFQKNMANTSTVRTR